MFLLQLPLVLGDSTASPEVLSGLFFGFLQVLFVIVGLIYLVFAFVVLRQIHIMQTSLVTSISGRLKIIGYIHAFLAVLVLLYFILGL